VHLGFVHLSLLVDLIGVLGIGLGHCVVCILLLSS
jgi:hypothetical protein